MKKLLKSLPVILFSLIGISFFNSCKNEEQLSLVPTLITTEISDISASTSEEFTATSGGNISNNNHSIVTERGVCWGTSPNPTYGKDSINKDTIGIIGKYASVLRNLKSGKTYYYRAYAKNSTGIGYGNELSFNLSYFPKFDFYTTFIKSSTKTAITLYTTLADKGNSDIIDMGICWSTTPNPTKESSSKISLDLNNITSQITSTIENLDQATHYYIKAYATNASGTSYSEQMEADTKSEGLMGTVTDIDGNVYKTIKIGNQIWMMENLRTTRYNNGDLIGTTSPSDKDISNETEPKYQWAYNGDENMVATYGRLYTWYAVTDIRNVAPSGWHVPSETEWNTLKNYLISNGYNYDGSTSGNYIAKSLAATILWKTNDVIGNIGYDISQNNLSGFTAIPGGIRYSDNIFKNINEDFTAWSSTTGYAISKSVGVELNYDYPDLYSFEDYAYIACSVRCVKDN